MGGISIVKSISLAMIILLLGCATTMGKDEIERGNKPSVGADGTPCTGVDRGLSSQRKAALAVTIAKQLNTSKIDVLGSFKCGKWSVIDVASREADEAFVFYADDPLTSHYITLWSGAATTNEGANIRNWVLKNAPGIPPQLADCFAWYVTKGRK